MDLLSGVAEHFVWHEKIGAGAIVLRQYATSSASDILNAIDGVISLSPLRHMQTPGGGRMSAAISACGDYGWISDQQGYRYSAVDPQTGLSWPEIPENLYALGQKAAAEAGFTGFEPDVCLINCYEPSAKMGLHQDRNEQDFSAPIVSVSLGLPATFQFGGRKRSDKPLKIPLQHGDVVVWGGESRLNFHGVLTVRKGFHSLTGSRRFNLTFRKAY